MAYIKLPLDNVCVDKAATYRLILITNDNHRLACDRLVTLIIMAKRIDYFACNMEQSEALAGSTKH